jgi:hypothetical protein
MLSVSISPLSLRHAAKRGMTIMKIRKHNFLNRKQGFKPAGHKGMLNASSRAKAGLRAE